MIRLRVLGGTVAACLTLAVFWLVKPALAQQGAPALESSTAGIAALEEATVAAIDQAEPSIVAIARIRRRENQPIDLGVNQFGRLPNSEQALPGTPEFVPSEYATGVIVGAEGEILTAHHVLQDGCDYLVTTSDRRIHPARIKGADPRSDLAVLKIEATGLTPIKFGDASTVKRGQFVIALGNPYAIARDGQCNASLGIVANRMRKGGPSPDMRGQPGKQPLHQFGTLIQTDARLNLGTSGGALINRKGEMIGLTISLAAASGYEQSAGFAIPVDDAFLRAVKTMKQGGEVEYGFLGVAVGSLQPEERSKGRFGVRVTTVVSATPAKRVGLLEQDVITHVNGQEINDQDQFMLNVGRLPAESSVILRVERDERPLVVVVDELSKYYVAGNKIVTNPRPAWRGVRVDYVTASRNFHNWTLSGLVDPQGSVLITEVEENSPAWKEGLRPDMMISHVAGTRVASPRQFLDRVSGQDGPVKVRLNVRADDRPERDIPPDAS